MAFWNKNTKVDTPFDNYKERNNEEERLRVARASEMPTFMSVSFVGILLTVILTLALKCESVIQFALWTLITSLMILLWSVTVRFIVPSRIMFLNIVINYLFVVLYGFGCSFLITKLDAYDGFAYINNSVRNNLISIKDMYYLTPMAIGFFIVTFRTDNVNGERSRCVKDIILPCLLGIVTMSVVTVLCQVLSITRGFVAILFASLILFVISLIVSRIRRRGFYFDVEPNQRVLFVIPARSSSRTAFFIYSRLGLAISVTLSAVICTIINAVADNFGINLVEFYPLLVFVILSIFIALVELILKKDKDNYADLGMRMIRCIEYPVLAAFVSIILSFDLSLAKLLIYTLVLTMTDVLITGFALTVPRRMLFARRSPSFCGVPAILMVISFLLMIATAIF